MLLELAGWFARHSGELKCDFRFVPEDVLAEPGDPEDGEVPEALPELALDGWVRNARLELPTSTEIFEAKGMAERLGLRAWQDLEFEGIPKLPQLLRLSEVFLVHTRTAESTISCKKFLMISVVAIVLCLYRSPDN